MQTTQRQVLKSKLSYLDEPKPTRPFAPKPNHKPISMAFLALSLVSGAVLALSAPGFGQWYLAWFALAPLIMLIYTSKSTREASARGALFGLGYHLVFFAWYTGIHPLSWMGVDDATSLSITTTCYLFETCHHTLLVAFFAAVAYWLPVAACFLPVQKIDGQWKLSAFLTLPLLWVLCNNKVGNAYDLLGVPWAMLEYTQYKQLPIIQIAGIIGGVGLEGIIVFTNVVIACAAVTFFSRLKVPCLYMGSKDIAVQTVMVTALCLTFMYMAGSRSVVNKKLSPNVPVSILQTDAAKVKDDAEFENQVQAAKMALQTAPGIIAWPASDYYFNKNEIMRKTFEKIARYLDSDILIGGLTEVAHGGRSHAMYKFDVHGMGSEIYKKRYLVPFGEYIPASFRQLPIVWDTQFGRGMVQSSNFVADNRPTLFTTKYGKIAPLVCFEVISPEHTSASIRSGGELLLDLGDRTWFRGTFGWMMGEQMLAMAVMRAVENDRYFVYLMKTGPSVIIEPTGRIERRAPYDKSGILAGRVQFLSNNTVYNRLQTFFSRTTKN